MPPPTLIPDAPWWANLLLILVGLIVSAITAGFVAWLPTKSTRKQLARIDTQVSNSHKTNLRDDVTTVIDSVSDLKAHFDALREDMGEVKDATRRIDNRMDAIARDVQDERKERLRLDDRQLRLEQNLESVRDNLPRA